MTLADRIENLRTVGSLAYEVSPTRRGWRTHSVKSGHAQSLFVHVFNIGTSLLRLVDTDPPPDTGHDVLDVSSIGSLTRNLLEAGDAFWYLVVEAVPANVARFRELVWRIHYHEEAQAVKRVLASEYQRLWDVHEALGITARRELKRNPHFVAQSPVGQRRILAGKRPYVKRPIRPRPYLHGKDAKAVYKYLSNQTHSHPFGVHVGTPYQVDRALDQDYLAEVCLDLSVREVAWSTLMYTRRMRRLDGEIANDTLSLLDDLANEPVERLERRMG